jgi:hypothetical protein
MNEPTPPPPAVRESRERYALFYPPRASVPVPGGGKPQPVDPKMPWTSDYPWRPEGMLPDYAQEVKSSVLRVVGLLCLILLLGAVTLFDVPSSLKLAIFVIGLVGLFVLFSLMLKSWQVLRSPRTRMRWTTFPAFLGDRLEGTLSVRPGQHVFSSLTVKLRCVQDEPGGAAGEDIPLAPHVIYEQSLEIVPPGDILTELPLAFDLPQDLPGNHLDRAEATYWQLAVRIPVTGPDIEAVFLAPVYERA